MQYKIQSGMTKRNTDRYLNKSALIKMKNKNTILSEQFQNQNCRKRHNYMTSPFPGRAQTLQYKKGQVKLVLWAQTSPLPLSEMIRSCNCFPHVSIMSTLAYNRARGFHLYLYYCIVMNNIQSNLYIKGTQGNL
jgi:hypothetical protein